MDEDSSSRESSYNNGDPEKLHQASFTCGNIAQTMDCGGFKKYLDILHTTRVNFSLLFFTCLVPRCCVVVSKIVVFNCQCV